MDEPEEGLYRGAPDRGLGRRGRPAARRPPNVPERPRLPRRVRPARAGGRLRRLRAEPTIRDDDKPDDQNRIEQYREKTEPLVAWYEERGVLERVDGEKDPDEVDEDIRPAGYLAYGGRGPMYRGGTS